MRRFITAPFHHFFKWQHIYLIFFFLNQVFCYSFIILFSISKPIFMSFSRIGATTLKINQYFSVKWNCCVFPPDNFTLHWIQIKAQVYDIKNTAFVHEYAHVISWNHSWWPFKWGCFTYRKTRLFKGKCLWRTNSSSYWMALRKVVTNQGSPQEVFVVPQEFSLWGFVSLRAW